MIVGSIKENTSLEKRVSITPESAKNIIGLGLKVCIEKGYALHLGITDDDYKLTQLQEMLKVQITKRGIDAKALSMGKVEISAGQSVRQSISMIQGIKREISKDIIKFIKDSKIKVQVSIQGDELRVSGKKRDDLQQTITLLKTQNFDLPLQFINFRD